MTDPDDGVPPLARHRAVPAGSPPGHNWAGSHTYGARTLHEPRSLEEAQDLVAASARIRALGSRHSFNDLADTDGDLLSLAGVPGDVVVDPDAETAAVPAAIRYGTLAEELDRRGWALPAMASLPHISVAGACATGTHGSGDAIGPLDSAVVAVELIGPDGELSTIRRGDPDFPGAVVSLGALGIASRMTLRVEPTYQVRQTVYEHLPWDVALSDLGALTSAATSVSLFTRWGGGGIDQVWCKDRVPAGGASDGGEHDPAPAELLGAPTATVKRHPLPGVDPAACTDQLAVPGPWWDRLPHFRMAFTPSSGEELQSEYLVARTDAVAAIEALLPLGERIREHLQVTEIRTMTADEQWLSPAEGRDTVAFHFTWLDRPAAVLALLPEIEAALAPMAARPHWGKLFTLGADRLAELYPHLPDMRELVARLDPDGVFANAYLERVGVR